MRPSSFFSSGVLLLATALTGASTTASAQTAIDRVPELFAGELDDVGPQYLLLPKATRRPVELWTEFELMDTSNATLVEQNAQSSTITSVQAGGTWNFASRSMRGGTATFDTGVRAQAYRYGYFAGRKKVVNFLEIDRNDFDLLGAHLGGRWERDQWVAAGAFRAAALRSRSTHRVFYQEAAMEWQLFRQGRFTPKLTWAVGAEGALRISSTDSAGLLPAGWNNRVEQGVVAVLEHHLDDRWRVQSALRVLGTDYIHQGRSRTDVHGSGRLTLIYLLASHAELRLAAGYDQRDSSEPIISDFRKWDLGLSGGAHWRF